MRDVAHQLMRALKWGLWIAFVAFSLYFVYDRAPHLDQFGHLTLSSEIMFGLPLAEATEPWDKYGPSVHLEAAPVRTW